MLDNQKAIMINNCEGISIELTAASPEAVGHLNEQPISLCIFFLQRELHICKIVNAWFCYRHELSTVCTYVKVT